MKIVFSDKYTSKTPGHVFRADKFGAALKLLLRERAAARRDVVEPEPAPRASLLLAHSRAWTRKLLTGGFTRADSEKAEIRITRASARAHLAHTGGTLLAARLALEDGVGINCGGGGHHARRGHGAGFCVINDIAVTVRTLLKEGRIKKAIVIDLDAHQGDGTASIFRGDRLVFTFSMHNAEIYPEKKERSSLDIALKPGTGDAAYLAALRGALPRALTRFKPDFAIYLGAADVYKEDKLGGLGLTMAGIKKRDAFVFSRCRRRGVPVALVLGGGYARRYRDTVRIHANTLKAALNS